LRSFPHSAAAYPQWRCFLPLSEARGLHAAQRVEVYLDASSEQLDELYINGGQRGMNLRLRVSDLLAVTKAKVIQATAAASNSPADNIDE
jgi:hypothetical protein